MSLHSSTSYCFIDFSAYLIYRSTFCSVFLYLLHYFSQGRTTNIGTFLSAIGSIGDFLNISSYDKEVKAKVFKKDLVDSKYKLSKRYVHLFRYIKVEGVPKVLLLIQNIMTCKVFCIDSITGFQISCIFHLLSFNLTVILHSIVIFYA